MLEKYRVQSFCLLGTALLGVTPSLLANPPVSPGGEATSKQKASAKAKLSPSPAAASDKAAEDAAAAKALAEKKRHMSFLERLGVDLREQLGEPAFVPPDAPPPSTADMKEGAPAAAPPAQRRGLPAPFDGPPYPTGEWQIGGTPIIGDPGIVAPGPLMQALYDGPDGDAIKASRIQLYGWEDVSANVSTSSDTSRGPNTNFPEAYDLRGNRVEQNQFVGYLERVPDEFQTDHLDWGFRLSGIYGLDYRYTISRGLLSDALLKKDHYYGFDLPMVYADFYIPWIGMGTNIRIGRIISMADIEAQLAPNNLMSSHSLLYTYDPYTQDGVFVTTKLSPLWTVQAGISSGNDVAIWQADRGRQPTGSVMVQWIHPNNKDSVYAGANAFNNADFGYNNIQQYVATYTHKFNDKWWTTTEGWFMYQLHATTHPTAEVPYQSGAFPVHSGFVKEWALLNYTMYRLGPNAFFTVRNEVFDDIDGNRTGYATPYSEHSIGITYWPDKIITIRPELRYEHSYDVRTYDNGTRKNQLTAQCDLIIHF